MTTNKLFVGGLPYSTTNDELAAYFAPAGTVLSAKVISDRESGRSKGFGFVEMSTPEEAAKAVEMFNNTDMGGRSIIVNEARPQEDRPRTGGQGGGFGGGDRRGNSGGGYGGGRRDDSRRDKRW